VGSKSRFTRFAGAALLSGFALVASACGAPPEDTAASSASSGSDSAVKACVVSDAGGFTDKSFNQSAKAGLDRAVSELGIESATAESHGAAEYAPNISNLVAQDCTIIFGVGYTINDAIRDAARANPDIDFALIDSRITEDNNVIELDNAKPLVFSTAEAAYLGGYLAAGMTQTGKIGTWGGMQIPSVAIFMDGLADGIARYNQDKGTSVELLGWDKATQNGSFTGDFTDTAKGKQLTTNMIAQGADIIHPVAGNAGNGALAAVREAAGTSVIWVDSDGYESTSDGDIIMTSVIKEIDQAVYDTIKAHADGDFSSEAYVGTLANGGVGLAPYHDYDSKVSDDLKAEIESLQKEIEDGTTTVETTNQP